MLLQSRAGIRGTVIITDWDNYYIADQNLLQIGTGKIN